MHLVAISNRPALSRDSGLVGVIFFVTSMSNLRVYHVACSCHWLFTLVKKTSYYRGLYAYIKVQSLGNDTLCGVWVDNTFCPF